MSLDEEGSVLRWWKNESRKSIESAVYMKYYYHEDYNHYMGYYNICFCPCRFCVGVTEHVASATTTTWPDNTNDRCFIVSTTSQKYFLVAETVEEKWYI